MKKTTKVLSIINSVIIISMMVLLGLYLYETYNTDNGWSAIGFYFISLLFLLVSLLLTVPMVYFILKIGFKNVRYYAYSHLFLVLISIIMLIISFTIT